LANWRVTLLREPTRDECMAVAMRYVGKVASEMRPDRTEFAAESAVWNLCRSRNDGCLDWPDDYEEWTWRELSDHLAVTKYSAACDLVPAFHLARLVAVRVRAWVSMDLSAHGPIPQARERIQRDRDFANTRFHDAKAFDIPRFRSNLEAELESILGPEWRNQPAPQRLLDRLISKQVAAKEATVEDFFNESATFMQDSYTLNVESCEKCIKLQREITHIQPKEENLPPFHLTCSCEVRWKHEWIFPAREQPAGHFETTVDEWVSNNVKGMSVRPPSIRDMLAFEEARIRDEMSKLPGGNESDMSRGNSIWRKLSAMVRGK
jgi:hypothetical protein